MRDILRITTFAAFLLVAFVCAPIHAQGQVSTTVGITSIEQGVFDNSQFFQPNQFLIGGATPSQIWGTNNKLADGITSIISVPATSTIYHGNAVNGFTDNYSATTAGVAGYFTARCSASNSRCWGINPQVTDIKESGTLNGIIMYGQETDVVVVNSDTQVNGLAIHGHFEAQPKSAWAVRIAAAAGLGRWKEGFTTDDGAILTNGSGLGLGAVNASPNSYSQILSLGGIDSSGAKQIAYLQATPSGGLNLATTAGTYFGFYNGPVAVSTLGTSTSNSACLNGSTWSGMYLISMCTSLREYKANISSLSAAIPEVMKLAPVSYVSRVSGNAEVGFIAEDVEKVDRRLSTYDKGKLVGVQYDHVVAVLTKAIQEQQVQINQLQKELHELKPRK